MEYGHYLDTERHNDVGVITWTICPPKVGLRRKRCKRRRRQPVLWPSSRRTGNVMVGQDGPRCLYGRWPQTPLTTFLGISLTGTDRLTGRHGVPFVDCVTRPVGVSFSPVTRRVVTFTEVLSGPSVPTRQQRVCSTGPTKTCSCREPTHCSGGTVWTCTHIVYSPATLPVTIPPLSEDLPWHPTPSD